MLKSVLYEKERLGKKIGENRNLNKTFAFNNSMIKLRTYKFEVKNNEKVNLKTSQTLKTIMPKKETFLFF